MRRFAPLAIGRFATLVHLIQRARRSVMPTPKVTNLSLDLVTDLGRWRAFVAIGELGSVTRAALFLDTNQSVLSRQINALERDCGARLFNRTGRGVQLSELGERLFPQVKALLADAAQLERDIRGEALEPTGRVTIGMLPSISQAVTGRLFSTLRTRYPAVTLKILEGSGGQVEEWLADARVDIAVLYRYGTSLPEGEQSLAVVDSYLIGRRGDALTAAETVPFTRLDQLPWWSPARPTGCARRWMRWRAAAISGSRRRSRRTRCRCRNRSPPATASTPCYPSTRCGRNWPTACCRPRAWWTHPCSGSSPWR